ncbi:MAG TPA: hypothetical protein VGX28_14465 [Frankiaceae bacterium]|jgi:hypothetical protein|nr:hypothetical protein [Frankiaceae bacterium]
MNDRKRLRLTKEILLELTPSQLAQVDGGYAATNGGLCAVLSIDFAAGCMGPTCGPGCTARSRITDQE